MNSSLHVVARFRWRRDFGNTSFVVRDGQTRYAKILGWIFKTVKGESHGLAPGVPITHFTLHESAIQQPKSPPTPASWSGICGISSLRFCFRGLAKCSVGQHTSSRPLADRTLALYIESKVSPRQHYADVALLLANSRIVNYGAGINMRVVSLLASATEIVCALGAGEMLVGRSHECDNPDWVRRLPPCSSPAFDVSVSSREIDTEVRRRLRSGEPLYHVDGELIRELRPDLLITQAHCEVCAVTPGDVERSGACALTARQIALSASSLDEIFQSVRHISQALSLEPQGEALVRREQERIAAVRQRVKAFRRPSVVMLEWTDPLFAMGNWGPELVEIANGELLLGKKGEYSAAIPAEQLRDADPEYLIVAPCGFNLERSLRELTVLEQYPWWRELQAVRKGNVAFADGNLFFNRSGMTISETAEIIAEILHGVSFGRTAGVRWRWIEAQAASDGPRIMVGRT